MSIEGLIGEEPAHTLKRQKTQGKTDDTGAPIHDLETVKTLYGRLIPAGAKQTAAWMSLAIEADYELLTFDGTIRNGDFLVSGGDTRTFRVMGSGNRRYTKGSIPTYYKYPLLEVRLQ